MSEQKGFVRRLRALHPFLLSFFLVAFLVTSSMLLFLSTMSSSMGIVFTDENIGKAAKLTLINVLALSLLIALCHWVYRRITVDRPVRIITQGAERMMKGDFSHPIPSLRGSQEAFDEIIDCMNRMAQELSGMETLRSDFIANVSHELKTPLAAMQNYAVLLQKEGLDNRTRIEYAGALQDSCRRLSGLVTNILRLNKLENQSIPPAFSAFDVGEQAVQFLLSFEDVIEQKGLSLETEIEEGLAAWSDPEMMGLVWHNLLSNAVKFTPPGGVVSLSVKALGPDILVRISDTGPGISPEVGKHIFEKFYQGDTSHAAEGNGLGLALVKRIMDCTGCDIQVESEKGKGTAFTVRIGRAPA
ncbi:MAG: HAMP domain-containing histidine kinase [Clostridiales bacterium]|nr:HAMP domain-containing histidine kinase [Clostridiales bacterium]